MNKIILILVLLLTSAAIAQDEPIYLKITTLEGYEIVGRLLVADDSTIVLSIGPSSYISFNRSEILPPEDVTAILNRTKQLGGYSIKGENAPPKLTDANKFPWTIGLFAVDKPRNYHLKYSPPVSIPYLLGLKPAVAIGYMEMPYENVDDFYAKNWAGWYGVVELQKQFSSEEFAFRPYAGGGLWMLESPAENATLLMLGIQISRGPLFVDARYNYSTTQSETLTGNLMTLGYRAPSTGKAILLPALMLIADGLLTLLNK